MSLAAHLRYGRYVWLHKVAVFQAARRLGVPWLGLIHDWSKLRPDEWAGYAAYFYGPKAGACAEAARKDAFDRAWLRHQHRNAHHPQHWRLENDTDGTVVLPMPERYVREMVADWLGAGMAIRGHGWDRAPEETRRWWAAVKDAGGYAMHHQTRAQVEALLEPPYLEALR